MSDGALDDVVKNSLKRKSNTELEEIAESPKRSAGDHLAAPTESGERAGANGDSKPHTTSDTVTLNTNTATVTDSDNSGSNLLADSESTPANSDDDNDVAGESAWVPRAGPMAWVQKQMADGRNPREILSQLLPNNTTIPDEVHNVMLWKIIVRILSEPPQRKKLDTVNTLDDVVRLIHQSNNVIVLTGAGVSVSCGIPDFRSRDGLYARLALEYPDLPDPQAMFDIDYFKNNPHPFFKFAKEIYPGKFEPSASHKFIKSMESSGKLLRNYTQNIDTLEQVAEIQNVINCHGSFATATCMICKQKYSCTDVEEEIMEQKIPHCRSCSSVETAAIIKPDIVFFGESLPEEFHNQISEDKTKCDLLIVIGSSLKVRPVSLIPNSLPAGVPQVLINRERLTGQTFDVELLGDCDVIITELARRLGWDTHLELPPVEQIGEDSLRPITPLHSVHSSLRVNELINDSVGLSDMETSQVSCSNPMSIDGSPRPSSPVPQADEPDAQTEGATARSKGAASTSKPTTSKSPSFLGKLNNEASTSQTDEFIDLNPSKQAETQKLSSQKSIATRLPPDTFLFIEPNRYIFKGAEFKPGSESDDSSGDELDDSDKSSTHSGEDAEILETDENEQKLDDEPVDSPKQMETLQSGKFVSHDEDAFDSFPTNSNSVSTTNATRFDTTLGQDSMSSMTQDATDQ